MQPFCQITLTTCWFVFSSMTVHNQEGASKRNALLRPLNERSLLQVQIMDMSVRRSEAQTPIPPTHYAGPHVYVWVYMGRMQEPMAQSYRLQSRQQKAGYLGQGRELLPTSYASEERCKLPAGIPSSGHNGHAFKQLWAQGLGTADEHSAIRFSGVCHHLLLPFIATS